MLVIMDLISMFWSNKLIFYEFLKLNKVLGHIFLDQDGGSWRALVGKSDKGEEDFQGFNVEEVKKGLMSI